MLPCILIANLGKAAFGLQPAYPRARDGALESVTFALPPSKCGFKGKLGEDKANLLGAMLVAKFQLAAMARANILEEQRPDFFLYIDEFQNFRTDSLASILSEARKYRLCLTLFHQYLDQLSDEVRKAVLGNVGSILSFRVGNRDADTLYREFEREYDVGTFTDLANHEICSSRTAKTVNRS